MILFDILSLSQLRRVFLALPVGERSFQFKRPHHHARHPEIRQTLDMQVKLVCSSRLQVFQSLHFCGENARLSVVWPGVCLATHSSQFSLFLCFLMARTRRKHKHSSAVLICVSILYLLVAGSCLKLIQAWCRLDRLCGMSHAASGCLSADQDRMLEAGGGFQGWGGATSTISVHSDITEEGEHNEEGVFRTHSCYTHLSTSSTKPAAAMFLRHCLWHSFDPSASAVLLIQEGWRHDEQLWHQGLFT